MKHIVLGVLAHVDAGKTTLSENFMYLGKSIRKMGRVDNKDTFFDTNTMERERGITIFSKQGHFIAGETEITLLDTPGHVDFSAEMERTLQVLDYAVLLISAPDGVNAHTETLWKLLSRYRIPTFIFVNKMDQNGMDKNIILPELKKKLSGSIIDFTEINNDTLEEIAGTSESMIAKFLDGEPIGDKDITGAVRERLVFPVLFGSALKSYGIEDLMSLIDRFSEEKIYPDDFSATVYKISRDNDGHRLTHMKIMGGILKNRTNLEGYGKINQIRIYQGEKYETADEIRAGRICAVTGLSDTVCGMVIGEGEEILPVRMPVLTYKIILPVDTSVTVMLPKLKELEEELPELLINYDEELKEIHAELMGEVQTEVIKRIVDERFGVRIDFGPGKILYRETINSVVEGVGHFEPLRHYAEVHLLMEPAERGSGLAFATDCSEDILAKNWQRLILTHLEERIHRGVLTGAPVTDMKITLVTGKAHQKHTEGGDFRQATYRAVRNGLMQAENVLLEPYYDFVIEIPENNLGRAMTDVDKIHGRMEAPLIENGKAVLKGHAPVLLVQDYQKEITAYTKGLGKISFEFHGYEECHNTAEVIEQTGYDAGSDFKNTGDSVFCANGAGYIVPWNEVKGMMHMPSFLEPEKEHDIIIPVRRDNLTESIDLTLGTEEIDDIIFKAGSANSRSSGNKWNRSKSVPAPSAVRTYKPQPKREKYLLVDGYNVIFAWKELSELAKDNIDGARGRLLDILCNYQGIRKVNLIAVFDAYRVQNHKAEILDYHNIHVVFTKEAETADRYIEKFAHDNSSSYDITVVTSDGLEQIIIRGEGCSLISSREFETEVNTASKEIMDLYKQKNMIK